MLVDLPTLITKNVISQCSFEKFRPLTLLAGSRKSNIYSCKPEHSFCCEHTFLKHYFIFINPVKHETNSDEFYSM